MSKYKALFSPRIVILKWHLTTITLLFVVSDVFWLT